MQACVDESIAQDEGATMAEQCMAGPKPGNKQGRWQYCIALSWVIDALNVLH